MKKLLLIVGLGVGGCADSVAPVAKVEPVKPLTSQEMRQGNTEYTTPCRVLSGLTGIPFCPAETP